MKLREFLKEEGTTTADVETNTATADNIPVARRIKKKKKKKKNNKANIENRLKRLL